MSVQLVSSKVSILGGGISGLSAAYYLAKRHQNPSDITVVEASNRLGGWAHSKVSEEGAIFEQGPRSLRSVGPAGWTTLELASDLNLESKIIPVASTHPGTRNRFIFSRGKVHKLPSSIISIFKKQSLFSKSLLPTILGELLTKRKADDSDETVYDFFSRRLNKEIAEYIGVPICRGIFAGDARLLSLKATFPPIYGMEKSHGSVVMGTLLGKSPSPGSNPPLLVQRSVTEKWGIWSLEGGLQTLIDQLHSSLNQMGVKVIMESPCNAVDFGNDGSVTVHTGKEKLVSDHVISTLSAHGLAKILPAAHSPLLDDLNDITSVSVGIVNLEYKGNVVSDEGFGVLLPSSEPTKILGIIYDSCLFPQHDRTEKGYSRLTVMMGGHWFEEQFGHPDTVNRDTLKDIAVEATGRIMGIPYDPVKTLASVQKNCISQYHIGHTDRVQRIFNYVKDKKLPMNLIGASYRGVGVNDCIFNAKLCVEDFVRRET